MLFVEKTTLPMFECFFFNSSYAGQNVAFFSELKITRQSNKPKKIRGASL
jgi:hypothetical protein